MGIGVRRFLTGILPSFVLVGSFVVGCVGSVHAASRQEQISYYGANLADVERATGVHLDGTINPDGPWPQLTQNYCFLAVVQALVNYA